MKKLFVLFLLLYSTLSIGEWIKFGQTIESNLYYEKSSISKENGNNKIWILKNYKTPFVFNNKMILSTKEFHEFDCVEKQSKVLSIVDFSGQMGVKKILSSFDPPDNFSLVRQGSSGYSILQIVCNY